MSSRFGLALSGLVLAMLLGTSVIAAAADANPPAVPAALPDDSKVAQARARLEEDRAGALAALRALWDDPREPEASAAAVALVTAMAKGADSGELADLCEAMLKAGWLALVGQSTENSA